MLTHIFHLHALSALHVGIGQAVGSVDLPIARAKATHLPLVPGSALKGVLRDEFAGNANVKTLFGPERIDGDEVGHAGALAFGDAHLLLLPVRSLAGVAAFVTCPFVLARYGEDQKRAGTNDLPKLPVVADDAAQLCADSVIMAKDRQVVLEDIDLDVSGQGDAEAWGTAIAARLYPGDAMWQKLLTQRFAIVSDDNFSFLADTATEIRARIRIDDARGVVESGALWTEENLPAETVLWGVIAAGPGRERNNPMKQEAVRDAFRAGVGTDKTIQIGGKATVGRGLVRFLA